MPDLFTLPKVVPLSSLGAILPGCKLHFSQTATSTPQNVYQDIGLTVEHANPVVADASGVFAPIYLDPSLSHYRVRLTDSADVQLWQIDDVPSNQNTVQTLRLKSAAPEVIFEETDATAGNKKSRIRVNAEVITWELLNDAENSATEIMRIPRSGMTLGALTIASIPYTDSGNFTGTLTGYASNPTPTIEYRRTGNVVTLTCNAGSSGTSNANSMTLTGLPVAIRPVQTHTVLTRVTDNGTVQVGVASVAPSGTITFGVGGAGSTFTSSGTKGLPGGWSLSYELG